MAADTPENANPDVHSRTWLKPGQVEQMKDACLTDEFPTYLQDRNLAIVSLLYDTGLRASELVSLDTRHLELEDSRLLLPGSIQKGNASSASLELGKWGADSTRDLRRYLRDRWKDTEALFPSRSSDRLSRRSLQRLIGRVAEVADVEPYTEDFEQVEPTHVHPHTLRHSVAYRIIVEEEGRLEDVQMRLRHANRSTTDRIYSHYVVR
ncbi:site-specific integrase [Natrinema hispanicum]|uniref:Integrase/recombinase XerC/integrase/recombinase XerD n=1 Tax=Natrinema hispanicum TaxID=392421 RepID=A0A1G6XR50_9EURY|nr:site-specific integrase [Natrinema hispanicum]SDD79847.1 integrase/recombinase XerC/integrase/recombinase XerD [Natrinema hispanicum]